MVGGRLDSMSDVAESMVSIAYAFFNLICSGVGGISL
jgi:hypothetical protein